MKTRLLATFLACLPALPAAGRPPARRISLLLDECNPAERGLFNRLAAAYAGRASVSKYVLDQRLIQNPIEKGKLLSNLENSDLVIAVGDDATDFTAREVEEVPVYFVDATDVKGEWLASPGVAGIFSYSVDALLDAIKALGLDSVVVVFTPGYERVLQWIRDGAGSRGIAIVAAKVARNKDLAPAVREVLPRARAVWLMGDPLLTRGAGFDFVRERTLSIGVPLIGPGRWAVAHGALLGYQSDPADQAAGAERAIDLMTRRRDRDAPRLSPAGGGGAVLINETLADKWQFTLGAELKWRKVR